MGLPNQPPTNSRLGLTRRTIGRREASASDKATLQGRKSSVEGGGAREGSSRFGEALRAEARWAPGGADMSTTTVGTDPIALIDVLTVEPEDQQATLVILIEAFGPGEPVGPGLPR